MLSVLPSYLLQPLPRGGT